MLFKTVKSVRRHAGALAISAALCACGHADHLENEPSSESTDPSAAQANGAQTAPELFDAMHSIATIDVGPGHQVTFLADGEGAVSVREVVALGEAALTLNADGSLLDTNPLELYLALTPRDRALPEALLAMDASASVLELAATRPVVESLEALPSAPFALRGKDSDVFHRPELCGADGADEFQTICNANASWGDERWCEKFLHPWFAKSSSGKKKEAAGITVACNSSVQTQIKRKLGGIWYTDTFNIDATNYLMISRVWYSFSYDRFVGHYAYNQVTADNKWIRSWIGFN